MTEAQHRERKSANRARRAALLETIRHGSKAERRRRFEAVHDEWRAAVGLPPVLLTPRFATFDCGSGHYVWVQRNRTER